MSHIDYPKQAITLRWVSPLGRHSQTLTLSRYEVIDLALDLLKASREALRQAQAPQARKAVARAMKSVEGARRHAEYHGWHGRQPGRGDRE